MKCPAPDPSSYLGSLLILANLRPNKDIVSDALSLRKPFPFAPCVTSCLMAIQLKHKVLRESFRIPLHNSGISLQRRLQRLEAIHLK